jgi:hypothetical protein
MRRRGIPVGLALVALLGACTSGGTDDETPAPETASSAAASVLDPCPE